METIWKAKPSILLYWPRYVLYTFVSISWLFLPQEYKNFMLYDGLYFWHIATVLSILILLPAIIGVLHLVCTKYEITDELIYVHSGILNRRRERVELYRVKDHMVVQPLHIRIFGLGNIKISSSDKTTPKLVFYALPNSYQVDNMLRERVENMRERKHVREFD